jgi:hypothetical protein
MNRWSKDRAIYWMGKLETEWKNHNLDGILTLFKKTVEYYEGPFSSPVSSLDDISDLWQETKYQNIEQLNIDMIAFEQGKCAMHWYLKYMDNRDGNIYEMDGTYEVRFNAEGDCVFFKQWWVMAY